MLVYELVEEEGYLDLSLAGVKGRPSLGFLRQCTSEYETEQICILQYRVCVCVCVCAHMHACLPHEWV